MAERFLLAISTFPDIDTARTISQQLVEEKLVACANLIPQVESIYRWKNRIESGSEILVFFKIRKANWEELLSRLQALHPYELPEVIALPLDRGLPAYLEWLAGSSR